MTKSNATANRGPSWGHGPTANANTAHYTNKCNGRKAKAKASKFGFKVKTK